MYLSVGVLPATAQRDLEILGCLGQLALSDMDDQNVRKIILHNLTFFDDNFGDRIFEELCLGKDGEKRNIKNEE